VTKVSPSDVRWTSLGTCMSFPVDCGCWFADSPSVVQRKSPTDCAVRPEMAGQATESERKIAGVAKPKKLCSGYPQSDGIRSESARKSSGSVKTSDIL
jgi:hypothetical protein